MQTLKENTKNMKKDKKTQTPRDKKARIVHIRFTEEAWEKLNKVSEDENRSKSNAVVTMVLAY